MTGGRRPVALITFLATVALLTFVAWWTNRPEGAPAAVADGPPAAIHLTGGSGKAPEGRFLLLHYPEFIDGELYEVTLAPFEVARLTEGRRVSSVDECGGVVTVAAAQQAVGFTDHVQTLDGVRLRPHEGLGLTEGFSPAYGPGCQMAYTTVDRTVAGLPGELKVWDPTGRTPETRLRSGPYEGGLVGPQWGPDGTIAVVRQQDPPDAEQPDRPPSPPPILLLVAPDGTATSFDPGMPTLRSVTWAGGPMALVDDTGTVFFDHTTGTVTARLPGWFALDWSPDGKRLLVSDAGTRRKLGVVDDPADPKVTEVARVKAGEIGSVAWLER